MNFSVQLCGISRGHTRDPRAHSSGRGGHHRAALVNTGLTAAAPVTLADGSGSLNFTNIDVSQVNASGDRRATRQGYYFNAHTTVNPGGAVRGQLVRQ